MQQLGELGVTKLIELLESEKHLPELIRLDTHIIERNTTARLKTENSVHKPLAIN
jgi:DNA-binding LacI/PurR family transcriptional regulator